MLLAQPFDINEHIFHSPQLKSLMLDAIRFFNGTPVQVFPSKTKFDGSGVYALYYTGDYPLYQELSAVNRESYRIPIYVGKAVPSGSRKGTAVDEVEKDSLRKRLREHTSSIMSSIEFAKHSGLEKRLDFNDFACRFILIPPDESAIIAPIEAALIRFYQPVWNAAVDGFGNHTPGKGRFDQAKSPWDVLHRGRPWAEKCRGTPVTLESILEDVTEHLGKLALLK